MKKFITLILLLLPFIFWGQKKVLPTDRFSISGEVKQERTFDTTAIKGFSVKEIGDIIITNHLGEKKGTATGLKGVLLRDVLSSVELKAENPKVLSAFVITCTASDGYTIVYSWNEIFNSATGDHTYLITQKGGRHISEQEERLLLVTTTDYTTGRRYMKGLQQITITKGQSGQKF